MNQTLHDIARQVERAQQMIDQQQAPFRAVRAAIEKQQAPARAALAAIERQTAPARLVLQRIPDSPSLRVMVLAQEALRRQREAPIHRAIEAAQKQRQALLAGFEAIQALDRQSAAHRR